MSLPVAVIGGGWAGCAAAVELTQRGRRVVLFEAGHELGGRARRTKLTLAGRPYTLDNGQHLLIGAYRETARLLALVGQSRTQLVATMPFEVRRQDGFGIKAAPLPAPWHLLWALVNARGLSIQSRFNFARAILRLKRADWRVAPDRSVALWLTENAQAPELIDKLWQPLTLAALNTPLATASAQILAHVLRDSLGGNAAASEMWLPRCDLSSLFPDAAARSINAKGGDVRCAALVESMVPSAEGWKIEGRAHVGMFNESVSNVIYAASPAQFSRTLGASAGALNATIDALQAFRYEPICTVYLKYPPGTRLSRPMLALAERPAQERFAQWVFDRAALNVEHDGIMAAVISGPGPHEVLPLPVLCAKVAEQLRDELALPQALDSRAIMEKRATLSAVVGLKRPPNQTALSGLVLAGDWTNSDYPSTLEAAVRSGVAAAKIVDDQLPRT